MKYQVITSKRFEKDLKRCEKRGLDMRLIYEAIVLLENTGTLPRKYRPHKLIGQALIRIYSNPAAGIAAVPSMTLNRKTY